MSQPDGVVFSPRGVEDPTARALGEYVPSPNGGGGAPVYTEDAMRVAIALAQKPSGRVISFSTFAELLGFAVLVYAAWLLHPIAGLGVAGLSLLFIGWCLDDQAAAVSLHRLTDPIADRWRHRRAVRAAKRANRPVSRRAALRLAAEDYQKAV